DSEYSTSVVKSHSLPPPSLSSVLTIKPSPDPNGTPDPVLPATAPSNSASPRSTSLLPSIPSLPSTINGHSGIIDPLGTSSLMSIATLDSYHTAASSSVISSAYATEGGSTIRSLHGNYVAPLVHRFTLLKPGAKQKRNSGSASPNNHHGNGSESAGAGVGWNPLEILFSSGILAGKCDLCNKRIGWKPVLECDDCGLRFAFLLLVLFTTKWLT
ncbi:hypothetical protein M413DRAFT_421261, partial [Hebeloma cylindrosporum]